MNPDIIEKFKKHFECLQPVDISHLEDFYAHSIEFKDPVRTLRGIEEVSKYNRKFNANLTRGSYKFTHQSILHDKAYLSWELELEFRIPRRAISVSGITVLHCIEKIVSHRNYYDAGELYYENLPIVGPLIRQIKRQLYRYG
ncbi:MAG: nuclear transport factor 2 family protein [Dyadobacter sp.]|uniref:nuclear transport factor 2 family protein n=1 Tax=Dyadobacter sp. TaxID=1914288 RepID=UPI003265C0E8